MRPGKNLFRLGITLVVLSLSLSIPVYNAIGADGAGSKSFAWNRDQAWKALEAKFVQARTAGCPNTVQEIKERFTEGKKQLSSMAGRKYGPADPFFDQVESNLFELGPLMAACPDRLREYADLIASIRASVKLQSRQWDVRDQTVRDRLYRLLYGGRTALEEVLLQQRGEPFPAVLIGTNEPSKAPSFNRAGIEFRSGDILLSRGGAPTSALIARGNDYPGNFSHVALLYVDEATGTPSIVESHIEQGVVITSVDDYIRDKKLRVMVLRLRADHPLLLKDPQLPARAAKLAYDEATQKHIPYDFEMNFSDPSKRFCSEVASNAYEAFGIKLWNIVTTMSSPGVVNWLSVLGVRYFTTQAPADLEYDPDIVVVAEWRDIEALWDDHVDNAVIDAMLEKADKGEKLDYTWYLLLPAYAVKAYSSGKNLVGGIGPIPEGMGAETALRSQTLDKMHKKLKKEVLKRADSFNKKNGYRPPYWELVKMAREAHGVGQK